MATTAMMCEKLTGAVATDEIIVDGLSDRGLNSIPENIAKVKSLLPADRVCGSEAAAPEPELATAK